MLRAHFQANNRAAIDRRNIALSRVEASFFKRGTPAGLRRLVRGVTTVRARRQFCQRHIGIALYRKIFNPVHWNTVCLPISAVDTNVVNAVLASIAVRS